MNIHNPEKSFFAQINKMLRDFIWDGKCSRISFSQLTKKLEDGGLKLFDLERKI